MHPLVYELKRLCERNREGSYATQANRKDMLMLFGQQLVNAGFHQMHAVDLRGRHIHRLVALWVQQELSTGTIYNRLSILRWWARHVGKQGGIPKDNAAFGFAPRQRVAQHSKAKTLPQTKLDQVDDRFVRMSLMLQEAFGLRREESIKIRPLLADEGHQIRLKGSWCKGGRERVVPITTVQQREVLDQAKALVSHSQAALIPADLRYAQQLKRYEYWVRKVGLSKMHGLRHAHFQQRYEDLTGFPCPVNGLAMEALTPEQRLADADARMTIAHEMGHDRIEIATAYLGGYTTQVPAEQRAMEDSTRLEWQAPG